MSALAQQQQMLHPSFVPPQVQKQTTLFVGSISGGITDAFLNGLLTVSSHPSHRCSVLIFLVNQACGPIKSFKRLITPANKPQGFGFAEFEEPDGALRALSLLNGVELPALEDGCANKKLLVRLLQSCLLIASLLRVCRLKPMRKRVHSWMLTAVRG
jgi:RNA-binding protein 25